MIIPKIRLRFANLDCCNVTEKWLAAVLIAVQQWIWMGVPKYYNTQHTIVCAHTAVNASSSNSFKLTSKLQKKQ